jgi:hypothetical protein
MNLLNPLTLNGDRSLRSGSFAALAEAIRRGADLRIATTFRHNEHIDTSSDSTELVQEGGGVPRDLPPRRQLERRDHDAAPAG